MKFIQLQIVDWTDGKGRGYTVFALGDDGRVYKSIPHFGGPNHSGWMPLKDEILPEDVRIHRPEKVKKPVAVVEEIPEAVAS